jgi:hypothetical protein
MHTIGSIPPARVQGIIAATLVDLHAIEEAPQSPKCRRRLAIASIINARGRCAGQRLNCQ